MRKERKARKQNSGNNAVYLGIIFLVLAAIYGLAYFAVFELFPLQFANTVQNYLLGKMSFLLPIVLLLWGWRLVFSASAGFFNKKTLAFLMVMLCLLGTAHHILVPIKEELYPERLTEGAGFIGGVIAWILHNLLGENGTVAFLAGGWALTIVFVLPWKRIYIYVKEMFAVSPKAVPEKQEEQPKPAEKVVPQRRFPRAASLKHENNASSIKEVYNDSEFDSFQDGIKKQSTFRRILSLRDDNIYEQDPVKEEIQKNPVKVPEWVERPPQQVIIRPRINYGDEPANGYHEAAAAEPTAVEQLTVEHKQETDRVASLFVNNSYSKPEQSSGDKAYEAPYIRTNGESMFSEVVEAGAEDAAEEKAAGNTGKVVSLTGVGTAAHAMEKQQRKVEIYDSAKKINAAAEALSEPKNEQQMESAYKLPPLEILNMPTATPASSYEKDIMQQCAVLEQTLADFRVRAKVIAVTRGPSVTRFELEPAPGVKVSSVVNLADDIALRLAAPGVRIEAPIPGKSAIGIEAPNTKNDPVCFREVVDNKQVRQSESSLCIGLGKDISGNIIPADLSKMPHLLVAGSTGSGKSVCINTIIAGILYKARPEDVKLILVDPKVVELSNYNGIPHLLTPVVTEPKKAASALHWAVAEMERRYQTFADNHVRDINSYNSQAEQKMPFIVIIIDELSDLMMVAKVDVEDAILRLAQKARAAGIHLILATQRPSVDVITGIVKANIPSRIAFAVSSQTDSRTIIDMGGAEKLLGKGDMLFYPIGMNKPVRVQGAFVSDAELNRIVDFIIKQSIPVNYSEEVTEQELECDGKGSAPEDGSSPMLAEDELLEDAIKLVLDMGQASSSMLQRRFRIGYTRAARLVDTMEEMGIVGQAVGSKPREVIMSRQEVEERFLNQE